MPIGATVLLLAVLQDVCSVLVRKVMSRGSGRSSAESIQYLQFNDVECYLTSASLHPQCQGPQSLEDR